MLTQYIVHFIALSHFINLSLFDLVTLPEITGHGRAGEAVAAVAAVAPPGGSVCTKPAADGDSAVNLC